MLRWKSLSKKPEKFFRIRNWRLKVSLTKYINIEIRCNFRFCFPMALSSIAQKRLFILGSFVVLVLAVLLYGRINDLVHSFRQIDHTNKIELSLQHTLSYLIDAETGQRGFLLTEDSSFLVPHNQGRH